MKTLALSLLLLMPGAFGIAADDALVEAAKEGKARRGLKSGKIVITNADVKKAKRSPNAAAPTPAGEREPSLVEQHEAARNAGKRASELRIETERRIAELEKELTAAEQRYYDEDDLDRRDKVLVARFNEIKTRLDDARKELLALSPALENPPPTQ